MEEELEIILKAVDDASSTFESVTESANEMGSSFTESTTEGTEGFEDLEDSAEGATGTIQDIIDYCQNMDGSGIRDTAGGMDELEKSTEKADEEVENLNNDLSIIDGSMLLQAAEQVGQLGHEAEMMAQDMNEAVVSMEQLSIQTGITEPELTNMINTITNAAFPHEDAMLYIQNLSQMGVAAENFAQSATDIDAINDAFGLGAQTTNSMATELGVLGVDLNNVSSAFNALAYANANTAGGMENFYTFLRKYDSEFHELGLNVDQAAVAIAGATQKFGGGKAALSGMSNALKESNGDLGALEKALDLEAGSLTNATALTGQYEGQLQSMADAEEEHTTILQQLGDLWDDLSLSVGNALSPLLSVAGVIGQIGQFGLQISGLKELSGLVEGLAVKTGLLALTEEEELVIAEGSVIARAASAIGLTTEAAAADAGAASFMGLAIAEDFALWPILAIIAAIALLVVAVYEIGKAFGWWSDVGSMIDAIWAGIQRLWSAFINHPDVQAALEAISNALSMMWNWIVQAGQAILEFFGIATDGDFDVVRALIDGIGEAWNFVKEPLLAIIGIFSTIIGGLWNVVNGNVNATAAITNIWNVLVANMPVILTALFNVYKTIWTAIFNFVISLVRSIVSRVVSFMSSLVGKVYSALMGVVSSIRSAIQAWITAAVQKVTQLVNDVVNWFKQLPGKISNALSGVISAITKPFQQAYDDVKGIVDSISNKVQEGLNYIGQLTNAAGSDAAGGELAAGGDSYSFSNQKIEVETTNTVILDLQNVPAHIDTNSLIDMLSNPDVLKALTGNKDFQDLDSKVKLEIQRRANRARGV